MNSTSRQRKHTKATIAFLLLLPLLTLLPTIQATTPITITGTVLVTGASFNPVRTADGNTIFAINEQDLYSGPISGTTVGVATAIVSSDGSFTLRGIDIFTGTVNGASCSLTLLLVATGTFPTNFQGQFVILGGTGGLANLHGLATLQGTSGGTGTYTAQIHFDPPQ